MKKQHRMVKRHSLNQQNGVSLLPRDNQISTILSKQKNQSQQNYLESTVKKRKVKFNRSGSINFNTNHLQQLQQSPLLQQENLKKDYIKNPFFRERINVRLAKKKRLHSNKHIDDQQYIDEQYPCKDPLSATTYKQMKQIQEKRHYWQKIKLNQLVNNSLK